MNAVMKETVSGELVSEEPFFAPTPYGLIDGLFGQYHGLRARLERLSNLMDAENCGVLHYFKQGNASDDTRFPDADRLFQLPKAIKALDADFWSRTLKLTDVYDAMPQKRRDEWNETIRTLETPEYTEDNVAATMESLMNARSGFLAEKVDGIFRGLSGEHVTNSPMAFGKRMIIGYVFSEWGGANTSKAGLINDLREIIAKFMGRDKPHWNASGGMLDACRSNHGVWHTVDGGALRVRCYLKGTAHLEVHPDMAWRLNAILHTLYPRAIPASYRVKPAKKEKTFAMMRRPLPFAVLAILQDMSCERKGDGRTYKGGYLHSDNKPARKEARRVMEYIGGTWDDGVWRFDYDARDVLREIKVSGCIPDQVAHQYYPTPESVAQAAFDMLDTGELGDETFLEPSAGTGALASLLPPDFTQCVEISELHCKVLEAKGYKVAQGDFIEWAKSAKQYDRILMNPPFSDGRWLAHVKAATSVLAKGGRLVAILPASARGKTLVDGFTHEWSEVYANEFAGTSVSVAIVAMECES